MEEVFWKAIDQWGADGLELLRSSDPTAAAKIDRDRLATFIMSFLQNTLSEVNFPAPGGCT